MKSCRTSLVFKMLLWLVSALFLCVHTHDIQDRISLQKCREYGQNIIKPCVSGKTDGFLAQEKEFPHMALIGHGTEEDIEWICSGSLISDQYILSVAHCAVSVPRKGRPKWIRLGAYNPSLPDDTSQDFNISEIVSHPSFLPPKVYNDLVLIKLDRPVQFTDAIRPACLSSGGDIPSTLIVSGWGEDQGAAHQELKRDRGIEIVEKEECKKVYEPYINNKRMGEGIKSSQICGSSSKTKACHIRSGSPLQYPNKDVDCMYNILGLLSTGAHFCGPYPDIYTYVPEYLEWIKSIVWPQN